MTQAESATNATATSQADERAADDVAHLLERLAINDRPAEQRRLAAEWVNKLQEKLLLEGRGQAVLEALEQAGESLARGWVFAFLCLHITLPASRARRSTGQMLLGSPCVHCFIPKVAFLEAFYSSVMWLIEQY